MVRHRNAILSPEDIKALEDVESLCRKQRATFPNRHVEEAGLKPWMRQFAAWYALEGSALKRMHQLAKANYFSRGRLSRQSFRRLLLRNDSQAAVTRSVDDQVQATRDQFKDMLPKIAKNIEWSIDEARRARDYKPMPAVVEPVLARTIPKKDEKEVAAPQIVVNLGGHFAKLYAESEMQEVEVEELPPPKEEET